jgi:hypothetical protein
MLVTIVASAAALAGCTGGGDSPPASPTPASTASDPLTPTAMASSQPAIDGTAFYYQSTAGAAQVWSSGQHVLRPLWTEDD